MKGTMVFFVLMVFWLDPSGLFEPLHVDVLRVGNWQANAKFTDTWTVKISCMILLFFTILHCIYGFVYLFI